MIVCLCRAKTDRDVLQAIEEGARSLPELQQCGIGTDCGSCHPMLHDMLALARFPIAAQLDDEQELEPAASAV